LELAIIAACCCSIAGSQRVRIFSAATAALLIFVGIAPVGYWLLLPLEARFPTWQAAMRTPPYGIIALGGDSGHRLEALAHLSRLFPEARLVYTGRGDWDAAANEIRGAGIDPARVILETSSRTTSEKAVNTAEIVRPQAVQLWLLITSAAHIPRAIGCFRHTGFRVAAYPVDFETEDKPLSPPTDMHRLSQLADTVREWIGLLVYRIAGDTDVLFPGP
jgi:uncharacterized SAM-binding protein YcdF (DUF218 family)